MKKTASTKTQPKTSKASPSKATAAKPAKQSKDIAAPKATKTTAPQKNTEGAQTQARKDSIHPISRPICFIDVSTGKKFYTISTLNIKDSKTKDKEVKDGIEYAVHYCDVTSDSHPAYTGIKRFVDAAGRVEKFETKFGSRTKPGQKSS